MRTLFLLSVVAIVIFQVSVTYADLQNDIVEGEKKSESAAAASNNLIIRAAGAKQKISHRQQMRRIRKKRQLDIISSPSGDGQLNILGQNSDLLGFFNAYYVSDLEGNDRSRTANNVLIEEKREEQPQ
jgi:hypothetical protein